MENIRERIVSCAGRVWFCAKELLKWLALAMITGVPCGIIGAAFDLAVEHVTELRTEHTAILFLLPVIGLVIVAFYKAAKLEGVSTDDMIDCVKDGKPIRFWLLPVMFISTVLTHLGGGSAGREGAALQMGVSLYALSYIYFSALFFTPFLCTHLSHFHICRIHPAGRRNSGSAVLPGRQTENTAFFRIEFRSEYTGSQAIFLPPVLQSRWHPGLQTDRFGLQEGSDYLRPKTTAYSAVLRRCGRLRKMLNYRLLITRASRS